MWRSVTGIAIFYAEWRKYRGVPGGPLLDLLQVCSSLSLTCLPSVDFRYTDYIEVKSLVDFSTGFKFCVSPQSCLSNRNTY